MRITDSMRHRQALGDLYKIEAENLKLLQQSGTGLKLSRPSDDPAAAARQLRLRKSVSAEGDKAERLTAATEDIERTELALDDAIQLFQRAKELSVSAGTGLRSDVDFEAIASEADQLLSQLVGIANRQSGSTFLFAGTESTTQPFTTTGDPISAVTYQGDSATRNVELSPGFSISLNVPGNQAFTSVNTFQSLIDLRDAARNHDTEALTSSVATGLNNSFEHLVDLRTAVGGVTTSLESTVNNLELTKLAATESLSEIEDADLVETLVGLQATEARRQATLQALARVIQPSLLDFLA